MNTYGTARNTASSVSPMISGIDHDVPQAAAGWLQPIAWQMFATLEFSWDTRPETAGSKFAELVNILEQTVRSPVCYVNCLESKSKSGGKVPNHYHAAFTSARPIPAELIQAVWGSIVGRDAAKGGDLSRVESYDPRRNGISYITKMASDHGCEWSFRNLEKFNPAITVAPRTDRKSRREAKRFAAQVAA